MPARRSALRRKAHCAEKNKNALAMTAVQTLLFIRHGATQPNLAGVRCGGDLDVPLTEVGSQQIALAAASIRPLGVDLIVASDLKRTQQSARILSDALGCLPITTLPDLRERMLGQWNGQAIDATETALRLGMTPPDGESNDIFKARIAQGLSALAALPCRQPLLVGSKGVARVLRELLGMPAAPPARNGEVIRFDLGAWSTINAANNPTWRCAL
jgi:2,3-bisphosphoglycerate-dependent phosphoglycerate mutase